MVRLVFRPYTQIRRTICTSVSLRASTRVSPGFALLRHSSPSFGSQQVCSHSNRSPEISAGPGCSSSHSYFHSAHGVATTHLHTSMDSLVRVSRRVIRHLAGQHCEGSHPGAVAWGQIPRLRGVTPLQQHHPGEGTRLHTEVNTLPPSSTTFRRMHINDQSAWCTLVLTNTER